MTDATTAGSHGKQKIVTLPQGLVLVAGAITDLTIARVGTAITATAAVVSALGTTGTATADSTLTTTEANIIASTATPQQVPVYLVSSGYFQWHHHPQLKFI